MNAVTKPSRARRAVRVLLATLAGLAGALLVLEFVLRLALAGVGPWGASLQKPWLYADRWSDPFYFQLDQRLKQQPGPLPAAAADPELGWIDPGIDPGLLAGVLGPEFTGRRPVLFFGDSFVRCMTASNDCFEGLMDRAPEGRTHALVNFGVRAYGLDQIALLARRVVPRWSSARPVVIIGIFVEDDLDRAWLDYRGWPKPRFTLDGAGALVPPGPVPTPEQYEREHPTWPRSLALGFLRHGSGLVPRAISDTLLGGAKLREEKARLARALLDALEADLAAAGVERFYVLFPSARDCDQFAGRSWQEDCLLTWLDERRAPFVHVRTDLLRAALEQGRHPTEFYGRRGQLSEHLTPDGNEVAFRALARGLRGEFDLSAGRLTPHPAELVELDGPDRSRVRFESGRTDVFPEAADGERVLLRPAPGRPTRLGARFSHPARRFTATARLWSPPGSGHDGAVTLVLRAGPARLEHVLRPGEPPFEIDLDVADAIELELSASRPDAEESTNVLVLSRPRFR